MKPIPDFILEWCTFLLFYIGEEGGVLRSHNEKDMNEIEVRGRGEMIVSSSNQDVKNKQ